MIRGKTVNCIAIWCTGQKVGQETANTYNLECHFNYWLLGDSSVNCFLDIGLMVLGNSPPMDTINIYLPAKLSESNLTDLGSLFRSSTELVSAIFNADYIVSSGSQEKTIDICRADRTFLFSIYQLDIENDVTILNQFGGSTISIKVPEYLKNKKHYYRIRLKCDFVKQINYIYKPPLNSMLEGAFLQTELVDFRVNEKRNLPASLLELIRGEVKTSFKISHFFLMREAKDDYIFSHSLPAGRQLESHIWTSYVGTEYPFHRVIAYRWSETDPSSLCIFIKFKSFRSNKWTIIVTLTLILIFGVIGSCIGNKVFSCMPKYNSDNVSMRKRLIWKSDAISLEEQALLPSLKLVYKDTVNTQRN
ncbi:MAG: hypothetical protein WB588_03550 [Dehalococcoidia bacterium]